MCKDYTFKVICIKIFLIVAFYYLSISIEDEVMISICFLLINKDFQDHIHQ